MGTPASRTADDLAGSITTVSVLTPAAAMDKDQRHLTSARVMDAPVLAFFNGVAESVGAFVGLMRVASASLQRFPVENTLTNDAEREETGSPSSESNVALERLNVNTFFPTPFVHPLNNCHDGGKRRLVFLIPT